MKQISLRLPDDLHADLKFQAEANRRSLHAEILWRLESANKATPDDMERHEPHSS